MHKFTELLAGVLIPDQALKTSLPCHLLLPPQQGFDTGAAGTEPGLAAHLSCLHYLIV